MRKAIGIILLLIGAFGFLGIFISKAGPPTLEYGIAYFLGRLSPILFLIIGYLLVKEKNKAKVENLSKTDVNDSNTLLSNNEETNEKDINFLDEFSDK